MEEYELKNKKNILMFLEQNLDTLELTKRLKRTNAVSKNLEIMFSEIMKYKKPPLEETQEERKTRRKYLKVLEEEHESVRNKAEFLFRENEEEEIKAFKKLKNVLIKMKIELKTGEIQLQTLYLNQTFKWFVDEKIIAIEMYPGKYISDSEAVIRYLKKQAFYCCSLTTNGTDSFRLPLTIEKSHHHFDQIGDLENGVIIIRHKNSFQILGGLDHGSYFYGEHAEASGGYDWPLETPSIQNIIQALKQKIEKYKERDTMDSQNAIAILADLKHFYMSENEFEDWRSKF